MKIVFWASSVVVLYTCAGYPLIIWLLSRARKKPWKRADITPSVSIVMAVHNGAALLKSKLEHLFALDYPNVLEIIAVSDGSTDGTNSILRDSGGSKLKSIILDQQRGKAVALNSGIEAASGEVILFVDIRPWIAEGSVAHLMRNFADASVGCAAGDLILTRGGQDAGAAAVGGLYWRYEQWLRDCEARFDSPLGVYGGYYAIRRELAAPLPAGAILDDMYQPLSIVRKGFRSVVDLEAKVFDQWPKASADEFRRKVRTLAGNFQLLQLAPWLIGPSNRLRWQLISHKLLRLAIPYLLVAALLSSLAAGLNSRMYLVLFFLQVAFYAVGLLGSSIRTGFTSRIVGLPHAFCMLNLAAVAGLHRFLFTRGPLWKIWNATQVTEASATAASVASGR